MRDFKLRLLLGVTVLVLLLITFMAIEVYKYEIVPEDNKEFTIDITIETKTDENSTHNIYTTYGPQGKVLKTEAVKKPDYTISYEIKGFKSKS